MESKEYFEKVMQDYNQHRNGRSLRKYCKDETNLLPPPRRDYYRLRMFEIAVMEFRNQ